VSSWLRARLGERRASTLPGGPSLAYTLGWALVLLLVVEATTGAALAAFYSPSSQSAWASVAYIQDQAALGWLVRGLHFHGGSAIVIVAGLHLVQTAVWGAYKKPRELVWWLGLLLLLLVLAFAISGYVLRWDQAGYMANRVELDIAGATPLVGDTIRALAIGGNEYGNLTLTRFYALHVVVLPAIVGLGVVAHVVLARRHGATPRWDVDAKATATPRWPSQAIRDALVMALTFAALLGSAIAQHGADLAAPADPSQPYDARPLWYFRWLFALRELAGSFEKLAALAAPAVVGGFLAMLPIVDRGEDRHPKKRALFVGGVLGLFALIGGLTAMSIIADAGDTDLGKRQDAAAELADRARSFAILYGVPATGALDVYAAPPMWHARELYAQRCKGCHTDGEKDRKGPIIAAGHHDRAWLKKFLLDPNNAAFWGKTKLAATTDAMQPTKLKTDESLDDLVERVYAETGAADVDAARAKRGDALFDTYCNDCHSRSENVASQSAPNLGALGSREWFASFIANPKSAMHMGGERSEMPRFDRELSAADRDALAAYLVWLRTATQRDVEALGPSP
jgi:ubiquinol-cytochrome c reductase cytochrome b subunit